VLEPRVNRKTVRSSSFAAPAGRSRAASSAEVERGTDLEDAALVVNEGFTRAA
jgi:hypothetical protein